MADPYPAFVDPNRPESYRASADPGSTGLAPPTFFGFPDKPTAGLTPLRHPTPRLTGSTPEIRMPI